MTTIINATLLQNMFSDDSISDTKAEIVEDHAIDLLNTYEAELSALTGVAGSKTGTYTSAQVGAIMTLAREVYATLYKNASDTSSATVGGLGQSYNSQNRLIDFAKALARELTKGYDFDRV